MAAEGQRQLRWFFFLRHAVVLLRLRRLLGAAEESLARAPLDQAEPGLTAALPPRLPELSPEELAGLLRAAGRLRRKTPACLPQALCLKLLLARRGLQPELRLGVRKSAGTLAGTLEAHAWVELDGRPVAEVADLLERFQALASPDGWP
ncbi:MAG TPA: lasso peptide biosynthesis B2 protein [Thermoanaerobaculia bacterium]|nr:lasso peptide biosynthesis B2 protein [Thermoanaerobaculia bacterium]